LVVEKLKMPPQHAQGRELTADNLTDFREISFFDARAILFNAPLRSK
jgi:hypothetical protein